MAVQNRTIQATVRAVDAFTNVSNRVIQSSNRLRIATDKIKSISIKAKDFASKVINGVNSRLKAISNTKLGQLILTAKDKASVMINKVKSKLTALGNSRAGQVLLSAKDKASNVIKSITSKLKSFTSGSHDAVINAKDNASSVLGGIKGKLMALAGGITVTVMAKIGFDGLAAEQNQKITITRVIENAGKTKEQAKKSTEEYYKYLEEFANKTPFSTADVATMGTKSAMIAKGDVDKSKEITQAMANTKAFVGDLRTAREVADAFFSAGNGNMMMLNNMLGTQYKTMDEALKGISKNQGGLVDEMANTVGGLWSTVMGKTQAGLKDMVKQFQPMISGALNGIIGIIDNVLPKIIGGFGTISNFLADLMKGDSSNFAIIDNIINAMNILKEALAPAITIIVDQFSKIQTIVSEKFGSAGSIIESVASVIATAIGGITPILNLLAPAFELIANVAQAVWPVVQGAIEVASAIISDVLTTLEPVFGAISTVISVIGSIVQDVWPQIQDTIMNVWSNLQPVLELFSSMATTIADIFVDLWPGISTAISGVWAIISPILEGMASLLGWVAEKAMTVVEWVGKAVDKVSNSKWNPLNWFGGSDKKNNAYGKRIVPYNGYQATLHEGERVLTKQEARQLDKGAVSSGGSININISNMTVREEADINKIADAFVKELKKAKLAYGGVY